ncbi:MAG: ribbon-helix-helix protein, CopG family [Candidatus Eremiobacteraeota bacterium]|nr:ribbon-helix-helix protein, CopG family [Candidatus Eremiobacteraeota bacterium]
MEPLFKLSVNVPHSYAKRLRKLRAQYGISASSMVEAALAAYLDGQSDAVIARRALDAGATLRREPEKR